MAADFSDIASGSATPGSATTSKKASYAVTGNILRVVLTAENWTEQGKTDRLDCGSFEIDAVDFSDPPPVVTIKAVAVPLTKNIRSQPKCKAWETVTLSEMAGKIADEAGMELLYDADENPLLDRADQRQTSDLVFLKGICDGEGFTLKVTDNKIVIFDEKKYEAKASVCTFKRGDARIIAASFTQDTSQTSNSATVRYKDPKSGKLVQETFTPDEPPATGRETIINTRTADLRGDAMRQ